MVFIDRTLVMPSSNASVGLPRTLGDFVAAAPLVIQYHGRLDIVRPIFEVHDGVRASAVPMPVFVIIVGRDVQPVGCGRFAVVKVQQVGMVLIH